MTSTNWDVAQDIGLIDIGFNIACIFYFATADGKESGVTKAPTESKFGHGCHFGLDLV